jgi:uncharacterized protein (DUF433 family)
MPTETRSEIAMPSGCSVIHIDPEIMGGMPVFVGTRVPAQTLLDYLEGGHTLHAFLDDFPSVSRAQALAALEWAKIMLVDHARAA